MTNSEVKEYVDDIMVNLQCDKCTVIRKCYSSRESLLCHALNDKIQEIIKENEELEKRNSELCIELVVALDELNLLKRKNKEK